MSNFFKNPFDSLFPKRMVGIDIGTSSIKMVELSKKGNGKTLENYAQLKSAFLYKGPGANAPVMNSNLISTEFVAKGIRAVLDEARIKTKNAIFSVSDFSTFCTSFDIPAMPEKEIPGAIRYNASQYITLPITEVTLDWRIIANSANDKNAGMKIFLIAIPNQVVEEYQHIAKMAGLNLYALEAECLAVTQSLIKNNKKTVCLVDIGAQSSVINIVDNGFLRRSYSFNFYSGQLSNAISSSLGISYEEAEAIKNKEGIISSRKGISDTLYVLIDPILTEIRSITGEFLQTEKKQVEEIYLTGGTANLPGLKEYFAETLKKNVYVPNCFSEILYPPILDQTLKEMSPSFSAAVGVALSAL